MNELIELDLLDNAHDFINESLKNLRRATNDEPRQLKFAVINLAQAVELMLKERLRREHNLLVYRNPERGATTVTVSQALDRLSRCHVDLNESDIARMRAARDVRNTLMHFRVRATQGQLYAAYVDLFEFAVIFSQEHLGAELHNIIHDDLHDLETLVMTFFERDFVEFQGERVVRTHPFEIVRAQTIPFLIIHGEIYERIPYASPNDLLADEDTGIPCHDCTVQPRQYHAFGCDAERCPRCEEQWLTCACHSAVIGKGFDVESEST